MQTQTTCQSVIATGALWLAMATFAEATPLTINRDLILAEHNRYRSEVGVPPLRWSDRLAEGAQRWANFIAALDRMKHSGTSGVGENLAYWRGAHPSLPGLIGLWGQEKQLFHVGTFPDVSRDGNWFSVGHYSQMVWRATTEVGCGIGDNGTTDFLVCWYNPPGNYIGRIPY